MHVGYFPFFLHIIDSLFDLLMHQDPGNIKHTFYTLYSGTVQSAPKEKSGEVYLWREDFDFFKDAVPDPPSQKDEAQIEGLETDGLDDFITQVADCLGLGRGLKLITEPEYEVLGREERLSKQCRVPTPGKYLTSLQEDIPLGLWKQPGDHPVQDRIGPASFLRPVWDSIDSFRYVPAQTAALARRFNDVPSLKWLSNSRPQLQLDVAVCRKMLVWSRMMLVSKDDQMILKKVGIFRGVLASIYRHHSDPSLAAAFLTYWNIDTHQSRRDGVPVAHNF